MGHFASRKGAKESSTNTEGMLTAKLLPTYSLPLSLTSGDNSKPLFNILKSSGDSEMRMTWSPDSKSSQGNKALHTSNQQYWGVAGWGAEPQGTGISKHGGRQLCLGKAEGNGSCFPSTEVAFELGLEGQGRITTWEERIWVRGQERSRWRAGQGRGKCTKGSAVFQWLEEARDFPWSPDWAASLELVLHQKWEQINTIKHTQWDIFIGPDVDRGRNGGQMLRHVHLANIFLKNSLSRHSQYLQCDVHHVILSL